MPLKLLERAKTYARRVGKLRASAKSRTGRAPVLDPLFAASSPAFDERKLEALAPEAHSRVLGAHAWSAFQRFSGTPRQFFLESDPTQAELFHFLRAKKRLPWAEAVQEAVVRQKKSVHYRSDGPDAIRAHTLESAAAHVADHAAPLLCNEAVNREADAGAGVMKAALRDAFVAQVNADGKPGVPTLRVFWGGVKNVPKGETPDYSSERAALQKLAALRDSLRSVDPAFNVELVLANTHARAIDHAEEPDIQAYGKQVRTLAAPHQFAVTTMDDLYAKQGLKIESTSDLVAAITSRRSELIEEAAKVVGMLKTTRGFDRIALSARRHSKSVKAKLLSNSDSARLYLAARLFERGEILPTGPKSGVLYGLYGDPELHRLVSPEHTLFLNSGVGPSGHDAPWSHNKPARVE